MKTKTALMPRLNKLKTSKVKSIDQSIVMLGIHKIKPEEPVKCNS